MADADRELGDAGLVPPLCRFPLGVVHTMRPTRNRPGLVASIVVALLAAAWSACTDSPTPLRPTASPPPNPTTLTGITISSTELILAEDETASIVIALDSDPGEDIEVWLRRGKTGADDIAFTRDRVTWAAADWREPRRLTLTAVVDYFAERLEAHELHVWTYRRGQIGAGQQILPKETIHIWVTDGREFRSFTGGGAGEVVLEWPGWGGNGIQRWQYRYKSGIEIDWGAWADIPNSDADTRSYRVTGLTMRDSIYRFQLRPWSSTGPWSDLCGDRAATWPWLALTASQRRRRGPCSSLAAGSATPTPPSLSLTG